MKRNLRLANYLLEEANIEECVGDIEKLKLLLLVCACSSSEWFLIARDISGNGCDFRINKTPLALSKFQSNTALL